MSAAYMLELTEAELDLLVRLVLLAPLQSRDMPILREIAGKLTRLREGQ